MMLEFLVILVSMPQIPGDCPSQCDCKWKSGKESVICVNGNLTRIPTQLEAGTQLLDLTGNPVVSITKDAFKNAGLVNLQKIFLSKCRLRVMDRFAFRKLINLIELDLSYNDLASVPSHVFDSISELRELKLTGNPIRVVPSNAFLNVPRIVKLELSDCRIVHLESDAFSGLETSLEWLKIDKNKLNFTRTDSLSKLKNLHGIELSGNPWNCSCKLKPLKEWLVDRNIPSTVSPVCKTPYRLNGKSWDKLSSEEFACSPSISPVNRRVVSEEGANVTIVCTVKGDPIPSVKWIWKNRSITNASGSFTPNHKKMYVLQHVDRKSSLTIYSVDSVDSGVYYCVASNKAGKVQSNVTLTVSRALIDTKFSNKVLVAAGAVACLFLVASCLLLCLLGHSRKEMRTLQEESYEKIEMDKKPECYGYPVKTKVHPTMSEYRGLPLGEEADFEEERPSPNGGTELGRPITIPSFRELTASELFPELEGVQQHILRKEILPTGRLYTTVSPEERNYPDLVTPPPTHVAGDAGESRARVNHVPPYSSATLPRLKNWYPKVSSSQSPLLAGSRRGSSTEGSTGSNYRFTNDSRSSSFYRFPDRSCERSTSSLNLGEPDVMGSSQAYLKTWHHPSLPSSPLAQRRRPYETAPANETPILNLLDSAVYDYHAAQLERFLEEYRSLQDQLTRMKETCEGLRHSSQERYGTKTMFSDAYST